MKKMDQLISAILRKGSKKHQPSTRISLFLVRFLTNFLLQTKKIAGISWLSWARCQLVSRFSTISPTITETFSLRILCWSKQVDYTWKQIKIKVDKRWRLAITRVISLGCKTPINQLAGQLQSTSSRLRRPWMFKEHKNLDNCTHIFLQSSRNTFHSLGTSITRTFHTFLQIREDRQSEMKKMAWITVSIMTSMVKRTNMLSKTTG